MDISGCPPLRLAICDDEPMDCALVAQMSREILGAEGVEAELSAYPSAAELLRAIRAGRAFHIFLLDVMMEGMDGMELAAASLPLRRMSIIWFPLCKMAGTLLFWPIRSSK